MATGITPSRHEYNAIVISLQSLSAELSSIWVMLENCRPRRLKGYGIEFDAHSREMLEHGIERLLAEVGAMTELLRHRAP